MVYGPGAVKRAGQRLREDYGPPNWGLSEVVVAVLKNPTVEGGMRLWPWHVLKAGPKSPDAVLAGLHRARLHWPGSTLVMIEESKLYLLRRGIKL